MKRFVRFAAIAASAAICLVAGAAPFINAAEAQQAATPVATITFRNVAALALNADGSRLLVADGTTNIASIYDTSDVDSPRRLQTIELDGTPLAATWVHQDEGGFVLVLVDSGDGILLQVLALASPREGWISYAIYDMTGNPTHITASVDGHWTAAFGEDVAVLMEVISGSELNSNAVSNQNVVAAALTETMLLAASENSSSVASGTAVDGPAIEDVVSIDLQDTVIALAGGRDDLAGALTEAPAFILFRPSTQTLIASSPLRSPTSGLVFMPFAGGDNFAIFEPGTRSLSFVPIVRGRAGTPQSVNTANPVQQAVGGGSILVTTNGQRVDIYVVR